MTIIPIIVPLMVSCKLGGHTTFKFDGVNKVLTRDYLLMFIRLIFYRDKLYFIEINFIKLYYI